MRIVAISVDPPEVTRNLCQKAGYTYTFLSDPRAGVIRHLDLLHSNGGIDGADIARPAEFLLDASGVVLWRNLTDNFRVRLNANQMLKVLDELASVPKH